MRRSNDRKVLVPYKITLLSNQVVKEVRTDEVLVPYKITLLSNVAQHEEVGAVVLVPYKITLLSNKRLPILYRHRF